MREPVIALLTDFGPRDWYVAAMKGVILSCAPRARFVDITHEVPPQDVTAGAFTLAAAVPWFPRGTVFLAVVDPGVGTERALVAAAADGRYLLGPDNGVLSLSLARARTVRMVRLTNARYWLRHVSRTFHGRDILAPVAAYLARGGALHRLGAPCREPVRLALPPVRRQGRVVQGTIAHIDAFGTLITNLETSSVPAPSRDVRIMLRCRGRLVPVVSSYGAAHPHQLIALAGSSGFLEVAVRDGSAARALRARRGDPVSLRPHPCRGR